MIVSHHHQFVFVAIPKTGTHSIRRALRPHLGAGDLEQVALFEDRRLPYPELAALGHGHISFQQIQRALGSATLQRLYKFAFVRNPFDRYVSYCAFISRNSGQFLAAPRDFMKRVLTQLRPFEHLLFRPQWEFVSDGAGAIAMDGLGRFEHIQQDFDWICSRLGFSGARLARSNESGRGNYRDYYDDELQSMVAEVYADDLRHFGYGFNGIEPGAEALALFQPGGADDASETASECT